MGEVWGPKQFHFFCLSFQLLLTVTSNVKGLLISFFRETLKTVRKEREKSVALECHLSNLKQC